MGLFNSAKNAGSTKSTSSNMTGSGSVSQNSLDSQLINNNKSSPISSDPISSIIASVSNIAGAIISGDANKKIASLNLEAEKLKVEAEENKADQALYEALKAKAEAKANEATQIANREKSKNVTNWLILLTILGLAFGVIYLVFKAVFGWRSKKEEPQNPN